MNVRFTLKNRKPRNPLVSLARSRRAGRHQLGAHTTRQGAQRELRAELRHLRADSP